MVIMKDPKEFIDDAIQEAFSDFSIKDKEAKSIITAWVLEVLDKEFKQAGEVPAFVIKSFIWHLVGAYHIILKTKNELEQEKGNGQKEDIKRP